MRIVFANKYWYLKGGAERYLFDLRALLQGHGHVVAPFAMQDAKDVPTDWQKYFVSHVETDRVRFSPAALRTAGRMLWSFEARRKFDALLKEAKPEIVHVHNIDHQISPSILPVAKRRGIPVVMTAHDYKLVAPNYSLYHDGAICETTKPHAYWKAVGHRCVKGSTVASALAAAEMTLHRKLGVWRDNVDLIIAPSRFMQSLLADYGVDPKKVVHVPHFIVANAWRPVAGGGYALFVGRLSAEKGVDVLIAAAARAKHVPVHIVGTGPDEARLKALAKKLDASNVTFRGFLSGTSLASAYAGARFLVVPSVWYEVFGLIVLEAYAAGKPVVATQIGGLSELVKEGETGLFASAGDAADLAEKIAALWDDAASAAEMGRAGREWVEKDFTPGAHYAAILDVYAQAKKMASSRKK
jgi:glycosyltransferase involved in cell wall biosynthesis